MIRAMAGFAKGDGSVYHVGLYLNPEFLAVFTAGVLGCLPVVPALNRVLKGWIQSQSRSAVVTLASFHSLLKFSALALIFVWAIMWIADGTYNPFIYFRF